MPTGEPGLEEKMKADSAAPAVQEFASFSLKQPVWHVIVLGVFSFKIYLIYWCYKNWRDLAAQLADKSGPAEQLKGEPESVSSEITEDSRPSLLDRCLPEHLSSFKEASPLLRAVMTLFPYINNYMYFTLILGIARLVPDSKAVVKKHPIIAASILVFISISTSYLAFLPGAAYLLFLLGVLPMAIAQHWLNCYWDSVEEKTLLVRHGFSLKELAAIIVGALYLGFICSGFVMGKG